MQKIEIYDREDCELLEKFKFNSDEKFVRAIEIPGINFVIVNTYKVDKGNKSSMFIQRTYQDGSLKDETVINVQDRRDVINLKKANVIAIAEA